MAFMKALALATNGTREFKQWEKADQAEQSYLAILPVHEENWQPDQVIKMLALEEKTNRTWQVLLLKAQQEGMDMWGDYGDETYSFTTSNARHFGWEG